METFNLGAFSCPLCDSYDRERLAALYLDRVLAAYDRQRRYRLIEFAPARALSHGQALSVHRVSQRGHRAQRRRRPHRPDRLCLCGRLGRHLPVLARARAHLVPLFAHIDETFEDPSIVTMRERWKYFGAGDHVRQYGKRDFVDRLTAAGFRVDQLGVDYFGRETCRIAGIADNSVLYVVRKNENHIAEAPAAASHTR